MQENTRVQECLTMLKQERKPIVRYIQVRRGILSNVSVANNCHVDIQLVENEDMIGTLIETNDRMVTALEMYSSAVSVDDFLHLCFVFLIYMRASHQNQGRQGTMSITSKKALWRQKSKIRSSQGRKTNVPQQTALFTLTCEVSILKSWGRIKSRSIDLDYSFSKAEQGNSSGLPPPLRPNAPTSSDEDIGRVSLSDFSDYESSDEETHGRDSRNVGSSKNRSRRNTYPEAPDLDLATQKGFLDDDPFADPFGDSHGVDDSSSTQENGKQKTW